MDVPEFKNVKKMCYLDSEETWRVNHVYTIHLSLIR